MTSIRFLCPRPGFLVLVLGLLLLGAPFAHSATSDCVSLLNPPVRTLQDTISGRKRMVSLRDLEASRDFEASREVWRQVAIDELERSGSWDDFTEEERDLWLEQQTIRSLGDSLLLSNLWVQRALAESLLAPLLKERTGWNVTLTGRFSVEDIDRVLSSLQSAHMDARLFPERKSASDLQAEDAHARLLFLVRRPDTMASLGREMGYRGDLADLERSRAKIQDLVGIRPDFVLEWLSIRVEDSSSYQELLKSLASVRLPEKSFFGGYSFLTTGKGGDLGPVVRGRAPQDGSVKRVKVKVKSIILISREPRGVRYSIARPIHLKVEPDFFRAIDLAASTVPLTIENQNAAITRLMAEGTMTIDDLAFLFIHSGERSRRDSRYPSSSALQVPNPIETFFQIQRRIHGDGVPPSVEDAEKMVVAFRTVSALKVSEAETMTQEELINAFVRRLELEFPGQSYSTEIEKFPGSDKRFYKYAPGWDER